MNKCFLVLVSLAALNSSIVKSDFTGYPGCSPEIKNSHECAQYREEKLLKTYGNLFERNKEKLIINIKNGDKKTYENPPDTISVDDAVSGMWFSAVEYNEKVNYLTIHVQLYEGDGYKLLNVTNGKDFYVGGLPVLSPDGHHFFVAGDCSDYTDNYFALYEVRPEIINKIFDASNSVCGVDKPRWINNSKITFLKMDDLTGRDSGEMKLSVKENQGWAIEAYPWYEKFYDFIFAF